MEESKYKVVKLFVNYKNKPQYNVEVYLVVNTEHLEVDELSLQDFIDLEIGNYASHYYTIESMGGEEVTNPVKINEIFQREADKIQDTINELTEQRDSYFDEIAYNLSKLVIPDTLTYPRPNVSPDLGTCQKCGLKPATTQYSDLFVCKVCDDILNSEFEDEYD